MLFVYFMGCLVPLILVFLYVYIGSTNALLDQQISSESSRLERQAELINNDMDLALEITDKLYYDTEVEKIALTQYAKYKDMRADYREFDVFSDYLDMYYRQLSGICVYLDRDTLVDNRYFKLITDSIKEKHWYQNTVEAEGNPSWSYLTNVQTRNRSLRLTRLLYTKDWEYVGIISVTLDKNISEGFVASQTVDTIMVLNDTEIVHSNMEIGDEALYELEKEINSQDFDGWLYYGGEKCLVTKVEIYPRYSSDHYDLITIIPLKDIFAGANMSALRTLIPFILVAIITTVSILLLSGWFSKRVEAFSDVMHKAAEGDFDVDDAEIGKSHDEIWKLNEDLHHMIVDIQNLLEQNANERIQKEQLYSRQKDVEYKMLAEQINPHFLYNTLENIRMLARINKQKDIEEISVTLTKLLRNTISVNSKLKSLDWEMEMIGYYITIQNYRFGDRISARVLYDKKDYQGVMVIPFIIQPFVENAYVHGMENKEADGVITIAVEREGADLCIIIQDNGDGMNEKQVADIMQGYNDMEKSDRTHIGIRNVNQRIVLMYGEKYGVTFESEEGKGTKVFVRLPIVGENEVP